MTTPAILQCAETAARQAGELALNNYQQFTEISLKSAEQYVTQYDKQCQNIIINTKNQYYPGHGVIGEEGNEGKLLKIPPTDDENLWWVIDPIDGTRNFAHGAPQFTVSIGVIKDGMPLAGVVYDPVLDTMYAAEAGSVATCNGEPIRVNDEALHTNSQIAISGNVYANLGANLGTIMQRYVTMNLGSAALHYAYVAKGIYAAALGWRIKLWDIAGGAMIVLAAGGVVNTPQGAARFPVDCHAYQGEKMPVIMSSPAAMHELSPLIMG